MSTKVFFAFALLSFCLYLHGDVYSKGRKPLLDENIPVNFKEVSDENFSSCLTLFSPDKYNKLIIINTQKEFDSFVYSYTSSYFMCETFSPPQIDFNKNTLLGRYTSISCNEKIEKHIYRNDYQKKYFYILEISPLSKKEEPCSQKKISFNWIVIPKTYFGYAVEAKIKSKNEN